MSAPSAHFDLQAIGRLFPLHGDFLSAAPYGSGHINDTFCAEYHQAGTIVRYILQRINHTIFQRPDLLMDNIARVTGFQQAQLAAGGAVDASRRGLTLVPGRDGQPVVRDRAGNWWRCYLFIEAATGYDVIESADQAREAARAFGEFQKLVAGLPGERLHETIPNFHHTGRRYEALQAAIEEDSHGRAAQVADLIDFAAAREDLAWSVVRLIESGDIPERVTHNDTKLNNVLIDNASGAGICVIDLDTVMPGTVLSDFGDMVRTATNSAAEDETDLALIHSRLEIFEALAEGYLSSAKDFLNETEVAHLAMSGRLLTFECGIRFLTDYLQGDRYFKIKRPDHNLDRCRAQFALVRSIEERQAEMERIVAKYR